MVITGLLPATLESQSYTDDIASGPVEIISAFGSKVGITVVAGGVDLWAGTASVIPIPPLAGEQMSIVSSSANDTAAGTGIQTVEIHYLDANGIQREETITMNGLVAVNTVATNIRFINDIYAITAGATKIAAGNITIFPVGTPATVYNQIPTGSTRDLSTQKMVPANKILLIEGFDSSGASAVGGQSVDIRLKSTSHHGLPLTVTPPTTLFLSQDSGMVFNSSISASYQTPIVIPSLAIVKVSGYALGAGQEVQASWHGKLVTAP